MRAHIIYCLVFIAVSLLCSQSQTRPQPSAPEINLTRLTASAPETCDVSVPGTAPGKPLDTANAVHLRLPDAPSSNATQAPRKERHNANEACKSFSCMKNGEQSVSNRTIWTNKKFVAAHAISLASIVFDVEMTHQGIAHHKCVENSYDVGDQHPSRGGMYAKDLGIFGGLTVFDWLMAKTIGPNIVSAFPIYCTVRHFQGGAKWAQHCW